MKRAGLNLVDSGKIAASRIFEPIGYEIVTREEEGQAQQPAH
jgi:hypothetical protein